MIYKELIPPILVKLVKKALKFDDNREYNNYSHAIEFCNSDAYLNVELCNMIAAKTVIYSNELNEKPYNLNPTNVFLLAAINQYFINYPKKDLTILDFGGACGVHYFEIKRFMPADVALKWYVVETAQMVKSAREKGLENTELFFVSSLTDINAEINIIYSSGALQYVPEPYVTLNSIINIKADWILFNRMMFNENDRDFVTVQKSFLSANGPGKIPSGYTDKIISYPHTTLSYQKFNAYFVNNLYDLKWIFDESSGSYQIRNEKIIGKGMLYTRKLN